MSFIDTLKQWKEDHKKTCRDWKNCEELKEVNAFLRLVEE